jgi:beta-lactamase regulating signal transducer with metallopeptidase domain
MVIWMGYALAVATLVTVSTRLVEPVLRARGYPARYLWGVAMFLSLALPAWAIVRPPAAPPAGVAAAAEGAGLLSVSALLELGRMTVPEPAILDRAEPWLLVFWLVSSIGLLVALTGGLIRLGARARSWPPTRIHEGEVLVSEDFGPALLGVRDPKVVIPRWALELEPDRLDMVVAHEEEHRLAGDLRLLLAGAALVVLLPWNAGLWWQLRRLRAAVELDCDTRVLSRGVPAKAYGALLLELGTRAPGLPLPVAALSKPVSLLERRLTMIVRGAKRGGPLKTLVALATAALLFVVACEAPTPTGIQPVPDGSEAGVVKISPAAEKLEYVVQGVVGDGTSPLVYVDEVRLETRGIPDLNPDDIARIEVIKGEAAEVAFGPEAVNGVIQIYTKAGNPGMVSAREEAANDVRFGLEPERLRLAKEKAAQEKAGNEPAGTISSFEDARIFVDGELFEGDITTIEKDTIDRVEVHKGQDGRPDAVYITLKKKGGGTPR